MYVIYVLFRLLMKIQRGEGGRKCGPKGARTPHLAHAMRTLYQMSYGPNVVKNAVHYKLNLRDFLVQVEF